MKPKKSLGQHWLKDPAALKAVVEAAEVNSADTVLEIGPGLGHLTRQLLNRAGRVLAVELDAGLAQDLADGVRAANLEIVQQDILRFDFTQMPPDYKVVANIPYYLTSNLIRTLSESANPPALIVLLVQKEVAERLAAPGHMSLLSISAQLYYEPKLGPVVPAALFEPAPKVDSRVIKLSRRQPALFKDLDTKLFFRVVKAGFSGRRKKLRGSLAAGLGVDKSQADEILYKAGVDGELRAQNLSLSDWHKLYQAMLK